MVVSVYIYIYIHTKYIKTTTFQTSPVNSEHILLLNLLKLLTKILKLATLQRWAKGSHKAASQEPAVSVEYLTLPNSY